MLQSAPHGGASLFLHAFPACSCLGTARAAAPPSAAPASGAHTPRSPTAAPAPQVREFEESKRAVQKLQDAREASGAAAQPAAAPAASCDSGATYRSAASCGEPSSSAPEPAKAGCCGAPAEPDAGAYVAPRTDSVCSVSSASFDAIAAAVAAAGAPPQPEDPTTTPTASPQRLSPTAAAIKMAMPEAGQVIRVSAASRRLAQMIAGSASPAAAAAGKPPRRH